MHEVLDSHRMHVCVHVYTHEFANTHLHEAFESLASGHAWTAREWYCKHTRQTTDGVNVYLDSEVTSVIGILVKIL